MFTWLTGSDAHAPLFLRFRSSKTFILITVSTAVFTDIFLYGIIVPVVPFALTTRAGVAPDRVQTWISILLAVYGAALLVTSPLCGWLADRSSSRRLPFMVGLLALAGSTVMLCVGSSIAVWAVGRALQGVSAAVVWVVGLALMVDTVGGDDIGQAMGYVGLSMSLAVLLAPLLGGIVFANAGYYSVFAMAFGLIVLDLLLRLVMVERKIAVKWIPEYASPPGEKKTAGTVVRDERYEDQTTPQPAAMTASEKDTGTHPATAADDAPPTTAADPAPIAAPPNKWYNRLPPVMRLLASRRLLFVRDTFGWNSTGAGLIFLPIVVPTFVGPVIGHLSDKHGPRWYATAGFVLACPVLILLRLVEYDSLKQKVLLCALLCIIGLGLILAITPVMAEITYAVVDKEAKRPPGYYGKNGAYAQAYSLFNVAWAGGCLVGPLLAGLVQQSSGWPTATLILGCVSVFTALPVAIWTGGSIFKLKKKRKEDADADAAGAREPEMQA